MNLVERAKEFAQKAHASQVRKYTGEPYFRHLEEVAAYVTWAGGSQEMIAAAYLHDTIEDTETSFIDLTTEFGHSVTQLVWELTDQESEGNRAERKRRRAEFLSRAPGSTQTIKIADLLSNTPSIALYDRRFAPVYLREAEYLLSSLRMADPALRGMLAESLKIANQLQECLK